MAATAAVAVRPESCWTASWRDVPASALAVGGRGMALTGSQPDWKSMAGSTKKKKHSKKSGRRAASVTGKDIYVIHSHTRAPTHNYFLSLASRLTLNEKQHVRLDSLAGGFCSTG